MMAFRTYWRRFSHIVLYFILVFIELPSRSDGVESNVKLCKNTVFGYIALMDAPYEYTAISVTDAYILPNCKINVIFIMGILFWSTN